MTVTYIIKEHHTNDLQWKGGELQIWKEERVNNTLKTECVAVINGYVTEEAREDARHIIACLNFCVGTNLRLLTKVYNGLPDVLQGLVNMSKRIDDLEQQLKGKQP